MLIRVVASKQTQLRFIDTNNLYFYTSEKLKYECSQT